MNEHKKVLFVGGKGGVGKSTTAAALALNYAKHNKKTLLVSTDPAHNVGDLFHKPLKNKAVSVYDYLSAIEIDPQTETKKYIRRVKENIRGVVSTQMQEEVDRQIEAASAAPGAEEAALFDRIVSIILDESAQYKTVIFDTAPTGHTIRLLTLPEVMGVWIEGLLQRRKNRNENYSQLLNDGEPIDDPIYQVLQTRKQRFAAVRDILLNKAKTGFIFVLNPERLPILETEKAIELLGQHELMVDTLIINKVLAEPIQGEFWLKRKKVENEYLQSIESKFPNQQKFYIPLFETDIHSVALLEKYALFLA